MFFEGYWRKLESLSSDIRPNYKTLKELNPKHELLAYYNTSESRFTKRGYSEVRPYYEYYGNDVSEVILAQKDSLKRAERYNKMLRRAVRSEKRKKQKQTEKETCGKRICLENLIELFTRDD